MRILEILKESLTVDSALDRLPVLAREMDTIVDTFSDNINQSSGQGEALLPVRSQMARWVNTNYLSSKKVAPGGNNVQSLMSVLRQDPRFRKLADKCLDDTKVLMSREGKQPAVQQFGIMLNAVIDILKASGKGDYSKIKQKFEAALNNIETAQSTKKAVSGIERPFQNKKPEKKPDINASQRSQVEQVVNDILSTLPKDVAAKLRGAISKSDNKLQALKAEMDKLGV